MVNRLILLSSSYSTGKRIALDFVVGKEMKLDKIQDAISKVEFSCPDAVIATHVIKTVDESWESVERVDNFFNKVYKVDTVEEFISLINDDCISTSFDVAKYISSKVKCSHIKLQKILYMCYAEYLVQYKEKLFDDKIYAFKYGPIIESVYKQLSGRNAFIDDGGDDVKIPRIGSHRLPVRSKILFSSNGLEKIILLDEVIGRYKGLTANQLIEHTHRKNSPWHKNYDGDLWHLISDEDIIKYHYIEV